MPTPVPVFKTFKTEFKCKTNDRLPATRPDLIGTAYDPAVADGSPAAVKSLPRAKSPPRRRNGRAGMWDGISFSIPSKSIDRPREPVRFASFELR